jgi:hypothetical protein
MTTTARGLGWLAGFLLSIVPVAARSASAASDVSEVIVSPERMERYVVVRDVSLHDDGTVSGVAVNTSNRPLRDVRLLVRHIFLWKKERHPGRDDPSRATYFMLPQELPPGGQVPFTARPESSLPKRADGRFDSAVQVASVTEMQSSTSATSGTSGRGTPSSGAPGHGTSAPGTSPSAAPERR